MAAAVKVISDSQPTGSSIREIVVTVQGDNNYPTGGYAVGPTQGLPSVGTIVFASFEVSPGAAASQTWTAAYDYVNNKVKLNRDNGELAAATNASTAAMRGVIQYKVA